MVVFRIMPSPSFDALRDFFQSDAVARKATKPLTSGAEVGLILDAGPARFVMEGGAPRLYEGEARDPDFTLRLPDGAVTRILSIRSEDVGEFGVEFFKLVLDKDPARKVRVNLVASTGRLLAHGYLGVLALGGMKVTWWLLKNGVKNPKGAIDRLRGDR